MRILLDLTETEIKTLAECLESGSFVGATSLHDSLERRALSRTVLTRIVCQAAVICKGIGENPSRAVERVFEQYLTFGYPKRRLPKSKRSAR